MKRLTTKGIVLHRAEVWTGDDYHFVIMPDGSLKPLVPLEHVAFHACRYNQSTIAIAIFGDFASSEPGLNWHPTKYQLDQCLLTIKNIRPAYPLLNWMAGHSQLGARGTAYAKKLVPGHTCPGEKFPFADILAKSGLKSLISSQESPTLNA